MSVANGGAAVRRARGTRRPPDRFTPYMPSIDVPDDLAEVFVRARARAREGQRPIVIVTPQRMLLEVQHGAPASKMKEAKELARSILATDEPREVIVVSLTDPVALNADTGRTKCIPFLGHLIALATAGHSVVVFEGHPTAFAAGVRGADLLLMDGGMRPFVQHDWASVAHAMMGDGARVIIHDRKAYQLLAVPRPSKQLTNFTAHVPEVSNPPDLDRVFSEARKASAAPPERRVVIVHPDRSLRILEPLAADAVEAAARTLIGSIQPGVAPVDAVVLACNAPKLLDENIKSTIPSIDLVRGLAAFGHSVVMFEGHASALAAGLANTDLLLVDGALDPLLPEGWIAVARGQMRKPRIVVLARDGLVLLVDPNKAT